MKKTASILISLTVMLFALAGCDANASQGGTTSSAQAGNSGTQSNSDTTTSGSNTVTTPTSYTNAQAIVLADEKSKTISAGGTYSVSGKLSDGQLIINTTERVYLELAGVSITNSSGAAIVVEDAKEITITLKAGTENTLTDGGTSDYNATLFSNDTIVLEGEGNLSITGNQGHGIESDDDIIINEGNITITALTDGVHASDNITINGGSISVPSAYEGIESKGDIIINDGDINLLCSDDGLNAATGITINGGNIYTKATKGDAIDSNGAINLIGGTVVAVGAGQPEGGIDCDRNNFTLSGGTLIATGGTNSTPTESTSTQPSVLLAGVAADTIIHLEDASGEVLTFKSEIACQSIVYSSPQLEKGKEYTIYTGGTVTGGSNFNGLYTDASYSGGTKSSSFTTESMVTISGGSTGMGGGGGGGRPQGGGRFADGEVPSGEIPSGEPPFNGEKPSGEIPFGDKAATESTTTV